MVHGFRVAGRCLAPFGQRPLGLGSLPASKARGHCLAWSLPSSSRPSVTRSGWSARHQAFTPLPWYLLPPLLLALRGHPGSLLFVLVRLGCAPDLFPHGRRSILGLGLGCPSVWAPSSLGCDLFVLFKVFLARFLQGSKRLSVSLGLWPELPSGSGSGLGCGLFFLSRFLHSRRSPLGFGLSCPSFQAAVWVAACFF